MIMAEFETLIAFAHVSGLLLIGGFMVTLGYGMLNGRIRVRGLLCDKQTGALSPGRLQLLMLTLVGAGTYLGSIDAPSGALPEVPTELLALVGSSNLLYLTGKSRSAILDIMQKLLAR